MLTQDVVLEAKLAGIVADLQRELRELSVGVYLEGSFAWGNPVATSDVDLRVVTAIPLSDVQRERIDTIKADATLSLGREVGIAFETTENLVRIGAVRFQRSRHLAGEDIRLRFLSNP